MLDFFSEVLTTMNNDRFGRIFGLFVLFLAGVIVGQIWAYAQHENRRDLCARGLGYCEEPVTPATR